MEECRVKIHEKRLVGMPPPGIAETLWFNYNMALKNCQCQGCVKRREKESRG